MNTGGIAPHWVPGRNMVVSVDARLGQDNAAKTGLCQRLTTAAVVTACIAKAAIVNRTAVIAVVVQGEDESIP